MELSDALRARRMVRSFRTDPVDDASLERILDAGRRAPSAGHSQGWAFVVLDTPEDVRRFWTAATDDVDDPDPWLAGMMTAPVVVVPCSRRAAYVERYAAPDKAGTRRRNGSPAGDPWNVPYWHMDAAMASLLILQTAVDEGLGACFFGMPGDQVDRVREEFGIPPQFDPVGAITIGHPSAEPGAKGSPTRRAGRDPADVVHRGHWSTPA